MLKLLGLNGIHVLALAPRFENIYISTLEAEAAHPITLQEQGRTRMWQTLSARHAPKPLIDTNFTITRYRMSIRN